MSLPNLLSLDLCVYPGDPNLTGIYPNFLSASPGSLPKVIRQDGLQIRLRVIQKSATTYRPWDDSIITGATVYASIDNADLFPTSGNFGVSYPALITTGTVTNGSNSITSIPSTTGISNGMSISGAGIPAGATVSSFTSTTITLSVNATTGGGAGTTLTIYPTPTSVSALVTASGLQTALNGISGFPAGGCTVVQNGTDFIVTFVNNGAQQPILANSLSLYPASGITVTQLQSGSTYQPSIQAITIYQLPATIQNAWTSLPAASSTLTLLQAGGSGTNTIYSLSLGAGTYDGAFTFTTSHGTASIQYNSTALQFAAVLNAISGNNWSATGNAGGPWVLTELSGTSIATPTVSVTGLSAPLGVYGELSLNTPGMVARFDALAGASTFSATFEIKIQFPGYDPQTILSAPIVVSKNVIRNGAQASVTYGIPGTVNSFSVASMPPWLTASVANPSTTPALTIAPATGLTNNQVLATGSGTVGLRALLPADLPIATTSALGAVKPDGSTITVASGVISAASASFTNPMTTLGDTIYENSTPAPARLPGNTSASPAVLTQTGNGTNSAAPAWSTAPALNSSNMSQGSSSAFGVVKVDGSTITAASGVISAATGTASNKGVLQPDGTTITVASGVISVPTATTSVKGVVEPDGSTILVSGGIISVPTATSAAKGIVEPDNSTININGSGIISVPTGSSSAKGVLQVDGTTITAVGGVISAAGGSGSGNDFKNRIINGDMRISQRNGTSSANLTSTAAYFLDRWYVSASGTGTTGTIIQSTTPGQNFQYALQVTGNANNTGFIVGQKIEATNIYDLAGSSTIVVSFYAASNYLTSLTMQAYVATAGVDNWTSSSNIATKVFTISPTLTQYQYSFTLSSAYNGVKIEFSGGTLPASDTFTLTGVQLESGSSATSFERTPYTTEFAQCQRYFYQIGGPAAVVQRGSYSSATNVEDFTTVSFPVAMRVAPTYALVGSMSLSNCSGFTVSAGPLSFYIYVNACSSSANQWNYQNTAGSYLTFSAEL